MNHSTDQLKMSLKLKRVLTRFYGLQQVGADAVCSEVNGWLKISLEQSRDDMNNIFSLVWECVEALKKQKYRDIVITSYTLCGFTPILFYFTVNNKMKYDAAAITDFIGDIRKICQNGECGVTMLYNLQSAAKMLQTFHEIGMLVLPERAEKRQRGSRVLSCAFEELVGTYKVKGCEFRNISEKNLHNECHNIKTFLWHMEQCGVTTLSGFSHKAINDCFTKLSPNYADGAKFIAREVRQFMTFIYNARLTPVDYADAIPQSFPHRRKLRFGFTPEEIHAVLGSVDRKTRIGKRDYAIMLIAAKIGLRACDIAKLKLSEIDWRGKEIRIVQQKTGSPVALPLTAEIGNAIIDYFDNARGTVDSQYMFPLPKNPLECIKSPTISALTTKYMNIAGIDDTLPYRGVHSFRRSFGKRLLDASLTPDMLMEMLGQVSPNSIKPYTMIYEDGLKRCSMPLSSVYTEVWL